MKLSIVLVILLATVVGAVNYGRRTRHGATLAEWAVGGRSLGTLIFWFMNAGEVYTTFAVLGISGYAWALGAPAYLAFCSVSLSYAVGYDSLSDTVGMFPSSNNFATGYGSHFGDLDNLNQSIRINNAIKYVSPEWNGLRLDGMFSFGGQAGNFATNRVWALGGTYPWWGRWLDVRSTVIIAILIKLNCTLVM